MANPVLTESGDGWSMPRRLIAIVEKAPFAKLKTLLEQFSSTANLRKSSKSVSQHLMLDIFELRDARQLVLTATLYFEYFVECRLRRDSLTRTRGALAREIKGLRRVGYLDENLTADILAVVDLRNEFVHNLFFDVADWDPLTSPFLAYSLPRMPKQRHLRALKNTVLLKILLLQILEGLHDSLPWLNLEDVPQRFRKRSSNSHNQTGL
jgi:hypothetical protein